MKELTPENIQLALARNFGGTGRQKELCEKYFGNVINIFNDNQIWSYNPVPVKHLIHANLEDNNARHLMIIGNSSSIVNLLTYQLRERGLDPVVIFGSQFPNDRDDYSYTVLSRIMVTTISIDIFVMVPCLLFLTHLLYAYYRCV